MQAARRFADAVGRSRDRDAQVQITLESREDWTRIRRLRLPIDSLKQLHLAVHTDDDADNVDRAELILANVNR